jgi:hypothetical protein
MTDYKVRPPHQDVHDERLAALRDELRKQLNTVPLGHARLEWQGWADCTQLRSIACRWGQRHNRTTTTHVTRPRDVNDVYTFEVSSS